MHHKIINIMGINSKDISYRIAKAAKERSEKIDLSNAEIAEIPLEIFQLSHLTEINLHHNQITEIPVEIS
jgi:internalin A